MLSPHRLSGRGFDAVAGGGGDATVLSVLENGQFSARKVLLRAVLDEAAAHPEALGPFDDFEAAWDLLVAANDRAPEIVQDVLLLPQVGVWLADLLRRLRGSRRSSVPLWVDVAQLRCVAVVAALRAEVNFALEVPVRRGVVALPSAGLVMLPARRDWEVAQVRRQSVTVTVSTSATTVQIPDDPAWLPTRRLPSVSGERAFSPQLDDVDPFRDYRSSLPPQRLSDVSVDRWRRVLGETWELLVKHHPETAETLTALVTVLVPVPPLLNSRPYSGSSADAYGAVLLSEPRRAVEMAEAFAHELAHTKLVAVTSMVSLYDDSGEPRCYAPWREDPRPVGGFFQGVFAFLAVAAFWRTHRHTVVGTEADLADFEFGYWRSQVSLAARTLRECPELTDLGRRFVDGMIARLDSWQHDQVRSGVLREVETAVQDHRATWRARHLRPDREAVVALACAWLAGSRSADVPVPEATLRPVDDVAPLARMDLRRLKLRSPHAFTRTRQVSADFACVAGESSEAVRLYTEQLNTHPDDAVAWVGLGLVAPRCAALLHRPELVRAVHVEVGRISGDFPDPRALAAWVGE